MSRIVVALAALPLVLVGCGGGDGTDGAAAVPTTIEVGGLLDAFPDPPVTATTERGTTTSISTTAAPLAPTTFAVALADLVDGALGAPLLTDRLVDDSGRLSLDVPIAWADRDTSTGPLGDGVAAPHLAAAPDLRRFLDGYDAAGLTVVVLPGADDLAAALDSYRFDGDCTPSAGGPYVGPARTGEYRVWRDCGGTGTDIVTVVADAGRETVLLLGQIREAADLVALDTALDTLAIRDR